MNSGNPIVYAIIQVLFSVSLIYSQPSGIEIFWEKSVHVNAMEFSPDGNRLITGGKNTDINCYPYTCGQMKIWSVADSTLLFSWGSLNMGLPNDIDLSSDGQKITTGNGSIYCSAFSGCTRDRAGQFEFGINGAPIYSNTNPDGIIYSIAVSPDKSIITAGTGYNNSGHINIYDEQYNLLRTLAGHSMSTNSLVFTPDGQYLISGGADGNIKFWDYNNGTLERTLQHGTYLNGGTNVRLSISADGEFLASTGEGYDISVKIWRVSDGSLIHTLTIEDEYGGFSLVEFSPNGFYLLNGMALYGSGGLGWHSVLKFYEVATGDLVREYIDSLGSPVSGGVRAIGISPTGNNFFAYSTGYQSTARLRLAITDLNLVSNSPVPVEQVSFNAIEDENRVTLFWKTATETNNKGFEVLRKETSDWKIVGFVEGQGTITDEHSYSFEDENISAGKYYYRLKQIDYDGSFVYSNMVEVEIIAPTEFILEQNYPNPFNPSTTIKYSIPNDGNVELVVFNAMGEEITALVNEYKSAGSYESNFVSEGLSSGTYFYKLRVNEFSSIKKMILLK